MKPTSAVDQFYKYSLEFGLPPVDPIPEMSINATKPRSSAFFVFSLITLVYVCFEFIYNRLLLDIASGTPTPAEMDVIEWAGRTMAGFGFALIFWRAHQERKGFVGKFSWKGFAICVALSIPLMWLVQEILIQAIVKNAEPSTLNEASIAMVGRQALLRPSPFFVADAGGSSEEQHLEQEIARKTCRQALAWTQSPELASSTKTLWALFGVIAINEPKLQKDLKVTTVDVSKCFVDKTPITLRQQHAFYMQEAARFLELRNQYHAASAQVAAYEKTRWASKSRTEAMWRLNADKFFGFDTTIPWGLSTTEFDQHPDVARLVAVKSGVGAPLALGLDPEEFKTAIVDLVSASFDSKNVAFSKGGQEQQKGEEAYKAVLVPLIGLSLSLFFGLFNAAMLFISTGAHLAKRSLKLWPSLAVAVAIAFIPLMFSQPLAQTTQYKEAIKSAWGSRPLMAIMIAWTVPAEALIE